MRRTPSDSLAAAEPQCWKSTMFRRRGGLARFDACFPIHSSARRSPPPTHPTVQSSNAAHEGTMSIASDGQPKSHVRRGGAVRLVCALAAAQLGIHAWFAVSAGDPRM